MGENSEDSRYYPAPDKRDHVATALELHAAVRELNSQLSVLNRNYIDLSL